ncbi:MAG TPA: glycosyltransferase 87 family protein [Actinomycetota bacterium]|nr:glycosyltransferase 87 family protein [Actinomycetota bacterium]
MAVASLSREEWRSVAGRLVLFGLLVFALTARAQEVSIQLHRFESGPPVDRTTYLPRLTEIAAAEGRPYRDFPVEYPPVSLGAIELVAGTNGNETGVHLVWFMVFFDLLTAAALAFGWGRRAAVFYLVLTVPLLGFLYTTIDLLSAALAVSALALVVRGRERLGGVAMAAAILAKVWPLALVPVMVLERKRRALAWTVGALTLGTFAWVWWGGPSGPLQVATQRHTPGWEYESLVGSVLWALGRGFVSINDSSRLGVAPWWAKALLLGVGAVGIALVWYRASRREPRELGLPAVAAVSILMLAAPLLSHPYVIWLAPWVAIAWTERTGYVRWLLGALMLVSGLLVVAYGSALPDVALWSVKAILLLRNALLAAVPAVYLLERRVVPPAGPVMATGVETRLKISPSASS